MNPTENELQSWPANLYALPAQLLPLFGATQPASAEAASLPGAWGDLARQLGDLQRDYFRQVTGMWTAALPGVADGPAADKRFASEAWKTDPRFEMLTRSYLAYSDMLHKAVDALPVDDKARGQWAFAMRHLTDALSPANFLASNPDAMQLVVETGGRSLVEGMGLLVQDLLKGRISMTDESAFELGRNVATTSGAVVYENELIQLIQYTPTTEQVHEKPLLLVPPCINKYYILDLQPENSLVRHAIDQGHTVFMLSWRNAGPDIAHLGWDDYLQTGVMAAADAVLEITGAGKLDALGFCLGGTLLACTAAVERAKGVERIDSITLLTTMLDFSDTGELGLLVTEESVASREATIGRNGLMRGADLALTFASLRANDLIWPYVVNSYLKGQAPPAFDLLYWNSDATNLPGPMYCWYLRQAYLENRLREPGGTVQCGVPVDFGRIDVPAFVYASREDHIVPWQTAYESQRLLGGPRTFVLGASGHIAGVINPPAKKRRSHWIGGDPDQPADEWLAGARNVPGSWWNAWTDWLRERAGPKVAARHPADSGPYRALEPAPGRYLKEKAA